MTRRLRSGPARPGRRRVLPAAVVVLLLLGLAALGGCGVRAGGVEPVPVEQLPPEVQPPRADAAAAVPVYLVGGDRLVRVVRPAEGDGLVAAVRALLAYPAPEGGLRSAIPAETALRSAFTSRGLATVDVTEAFTEVRGRDQLLAVAQLVWTVTEHAPRRRVVILVEGRALPVPVDRGAVTPDPVGRDHYASVAPD